MIILAKHNTIARPCMHAHTNWRPTSRSCLADMAGGCQDAVASTAFIEVSQSLCRHGGTGKFWANMCLVALLSLTLATRNTRTHTGVRPVAFTDVVSGTSHVRSLDKMAIVDDYSGHYWKKYFRFHIDRTLVVHVMYLYTLIEMVRPVALLPEPTSRVYVACWRGLVL